MCYRGKLIRKYPFQRYYQSNGILYTALGALILVEIENSRRLKFSIDDTICDFSSITAGPIAPIGLSEVGDEVIVQAEANDNYYPIIKSFYNVSMELGNSTLLNK